MVRREDVKVKPGFEYDHYFPKAKLITIRKKRGATVADTLLLIPAVVRETLFHTKRFADEVIKADTVEQTCRNLWEFVYHHIAYKKDEDGKEQVRSPARSWHDRHNFDEHGEPSGCDCDCLSTFCVSVLCNCGIDNIFFRITKYPQIGKISSEIPWSHIYPVVILPDGKQITIDCVVHQFNYEEPYLQKKDTRMDLEYLNGIPDTSKYKTAEFNDFMDIASEKEAMGELGKLFKRKASSGDSGGGKKKGFAKLKEIAKKGLHLTNILNPATATLRAGVLAAMKLNFMKIGSQIRYAYLTEEQAKAKGLIMDRYHKMKTIREKLEKIFYGAGGKPENLKKAILTGRGNKNKEVPMNGLDYITYGNVDGLHEDMSLSELLGIDVLASEGIVKAVEGLEGLGALGEPATAATIAAATTVLTTIAALIKKVGSLVPKKAGASEGDSGGDTDGGDGGSGDSVTDNDAGGGSDDSTSGSSNGAKTPAITNNDSSGTSSGSEGSTDSGGGDADTADTGGSQKSLTTTTSTTAAKPSFWQNNKKWIKPVGIGVGSLGLIALIYHLLKPKVKPKQVLNGPPKKKGGKSRTDLLSGIPSKKKKGGHQAKARKAKGKKKVVTLL
ncbi:MAG: hypothetical protein ACJ77K_06460 [Bacteroidia bacterium]